MRAQGGPAGNSRFEQRQIDAFAKRVETRGGHFIPGPPRRRGQASNRINAVRPALQFLVRR
jgi:hypothetical protein